MHASSSSFPLSGPPLKSINRWAEEEEEEEEEGEAVFSKVGKRDSAWNGRGVWWVDGKGRERGVIER